MTLDDLDLVGSEVGVQQETEDFFQANDGKPIIFTRFGLITGLDQDKLIIQWRDGTIETVSVELISYIDGVKV